MDWHVEVCRLEVVSHLPKTLQSVLPFTLLKPIQLCWLAAGLITHTNQQSPDTLKTLKGAIFNYWEKKHYICNLHISNKDCIYPSSFMESSKRYVIIHVLHILKHMATKLKAINGSTEKEAFGWV